MKNNSIWREELQRLEKTLAVVREEKRKCEEDLGITNGQDKLIHVLDDGSNEAVVQQFLVGNKLRSLHQLRLSSKQPYFARLDFCPDPQSPTMGLLNPGETTPVYVGRWSVMETPSYKIWVADWRSPIANLYYSGQLGKISYEAPDGKVEGELSLKRMFTIAEGKLEDYQDTGLAGQEKYLTDALGQMTSNRLREVVTTIQAEQNQVIRFDAFRPLCVQGVAGSGKTTIALHRMAWLLYHLQKKVAPSQMLILAPNPLFLSYISRVLPDLGVEDVQQTTFHGLCKRLLKKNMPKIKENERLSQRLAMSRPERDGLDAVLRKKGSLHLAERIEKYLLIAEESCLPGQDISFLGKVVMPLLELRTFFLRDLRHFPLAQRRQMIEKTLKKRVDAYVQEARTAMEKLVDKRLTALLQSMPDGPERRKKATELLSARDGRLLELDERKKSFIRECGKLWGSLDLLEQYEMFWRWETQQDPSADAVLRTTLPLLEKRSVAGEDLPALLLLAKGITGLEKAEAKHVMIDEAQDVSPLQIKALRTIFGHDAFTLVGDLCQGIYGDEGLRSWEDLGEGIFKNTPEVARLSTSYRSTVEIMKTAFRVLAKHPVPGEGNARPVERHGDEPEKYIVTNEKQRIESLCRLVECWQEKGLRSIALVAKDAAAAAKLYKGLKNRMELTLIRQGDDCFNGGVQVADSSMVKGLEFDGVIIADADGETYPNEPFYAKLFYVLCTRPLHKLAFVAMDQLTPLLD